MEKTTKKNINDTHIISLKLKKYYYLHKKDYKKNNMFYKKYKR